MPVNGLQKFSLIDYPGKLCAVIFFGNCNFRCPFCHNPALVFDPESQGRITPDELHDFLLKRQNKLEGVVLSGGEPTLSDLLFEVALTAKKLNYAVKLDTNGSNFTVIEKLYRQNLLDALGIDYKAPAKDYGKICGNSHPEIYQNVQRSIRFAVNAQITLDVRTTVHQALLSEYDLEIMYGELAALGVVEWTLQQFHKAEILDDSLLDEITYSDSELCRIAEKLGKSVKVRGIVK